MTHHLRVGALLCRPVAVVVGFAYPAFASWKALEGKTAVKGAPVQGRDAWLTYWIVFSCFNVVEHLADVLISW